MSLEQFLAVMDEIESTRGGGGGFAIVCKAQVNWAFRGGFAKTSKFFPFKYDDAQDKARAQAECLAYMKEINEATWADGRAKWPVIGLLTRLHGDDVPTAESGKRWETMPDMAWLDFTDAYHTDKVFANMTELTDEEKATVTGSMPATAIIDNLKTIDPPLDLFQKPLWCKLTQEVNQWEQLNVALGKRSPNTYTDNSGEEKVVPYRFWLIQHVYANEAEAKADAETIKAGQGGSQSTDNGSQLSAKALEVWGDTNEVALAALRESKEDIQKTIKNAEKGLDGDGKKMPKKNPSEAQEYAADVYNIELLDLGVIGIEVTPF